GRITRHSVGVRRYHGGGSATHSLDPCRHQPSNGDALRSYQLRHRRSWRTWEDVGKPGWRANIGGRHRRCPSLHHCGDCLRCRFPDPDPCPCIPPGRSSEKMIGKPGLTLYGLFIVMALLAAAALLLGVAVSSILVLLLVYAALAYSINFITRMIGYVDFGHVLF